MTGGELQLVVDKLETYVPPTAAVYSSGLSDQGLIFSDVNSLYGASTNLLIPQTTLNVDDIGLSATRTDLLTALGEDSRFLSYVGHSSFAIWGLNPQALWYGIALNGDEPERSRAAARTFPGNFLFSTGPNTQGGIRVIWPDGSETIRPNVSAGETLVIDQP